MSPAPTKSSRTPRPWRLLTVAALLTVACGHLALGASAKALTSPPSVVAGTTDGAPRPTSPTTHNGRLAMPKPGAARLSFVDFGTTAPPITPIPDPTTTSFPSHNSSASEFSNSSDTLMGSNSNSSSSLVGSNSNSSGSNSLVGSSSNSSGSLVGSSDSNSLVGSNSSSSSLVGSNSSSGSLVGSSSNSSGSNSLVGSSSNSSGSLVGSSDSSDSSSLVGSNSSSGSLVGSSSNSSGSNSLVGSSSNSSGSLVGSSDSSDSSSLVGSSSNSSGSNSLVGSSSNSSGSLVGSSDSSDSNSLVGSNSGSNNLVGSSDSSDSSDSLVGSSSSSSNSSSTVDGGVSSNSDFNTTTTTTTTTSSPCNFHCIPYLTTAQCVATGAVLNALRTAFPAQLENVWAGSNFCLWKQVQCSLGGVVVLIPYWNLQGTMPAVPVEVAPADVAVSALILTGNTGITGTLDKSWRRLPKLRVLDVTGCSLSDASSDS
ncbi:hypothetical protein ABB37_06434 [Leptomonas pyrrhocoris]|uniref:Proteophosphoglycan ppg4 n=1 Tax=Leptomonas pyrrhocoris TaxID=157538 RepID=A0A0M9FY11_LEPPY|nr:hypothetical protein ABB37_06434 [Leptomonas pyrrhocoris]XP_015656733.1 hypothetical protein ABB37_06434 [Leptomonas pyrrhocoris]KPA78293.1 hypothetical protein ABB37_06434 [Leptomonas pyrrhocoris]KPA78294.1 hypothetical protein ABB37_06434 [Leptomonas pyrrhocoris]|eukprot:XP_015656732.1 hypothetical protein ABB37_06434 [Leptomonas pyrrhocoris]